MRYAIFRRADSARSMTEVISERIRGHERDLGDGFVVRRVLPSSAKRAIGPFIFMDHMGPITLAADRAIDVRPHPHIGLATVTYLWEGRVEHRDSLDNIVGMIHVFDVFKVAGERMPALRPVTKTTPTKRANELLFELLRARRQIALVYDEQSTVVGLVTLEDLLEELVGEIRDEHDEPSPDAPVSAKP